MESATIIGTPFFFLERCHGIMVRSTIIQEYPGFPDIPWQMSLALVEVSVDLHGAGYHAFGLEGLGKPECFIFRQIKGWNRRWQNAKIKDIPEGVTLFAKLLLQ